MKHPCPIRGCTVDDVPSHQLLCRPHWAMAPIPLRVTITKLFANGNPKPGYEEACASAIEQVTARISKEEARRIGRFDIRSERT